jgi:ABC-2 type transport system permease protein
MSLLLHELRVRRGAIVGWALGLGLFLSLYTTIYRFLPAEVREMDVRALAFLNSLGIQTFATFEGFILGTAFNFGPLLVGLFGVIIGVGALAGEEDEGTLELLAALPVSRCACCWRSRPRSASPPWSSWLWPGPSRRSCLRCGRSTRR